MALNVSCTKTYPGILNNYITEHLCSPSIDILKFSVCHFHYIMCIKNYWKNKFASSGTQTHISRVNSCHATTKAKINSIKSVYCLLLQSHPKLVCFLCFIEIILQPINYTSNSWTNDFAITKATHCPFKRKTYIVGQISRIYPQNI